MTIKCDVRVNDAPLGTAHTVTMAFNSTYVFKYVDFGYSDPNDSADQCSSGGENHDAAFERQPNR